MDQLERRVAARLTASGERGSVPANFADRIMHTIEVRGRRRRRALVLGAAVTVTAVLTVPTFGILDQRVGSPNPPAPSSDRSLADLPAVIGISAVVAIPRALPGGSVLQAQALGADGTVVGVGLSEDGEWDDQMWIAHPADPVPRAVDGPRVAEAASSPAVSEQSLFWVERRDEQQDLFTVCTELRRTGPVHELGANRMLGGSVPVLVDEGIGVWTSPGTDPPGGRDDRVTGPPTVWLVRGCGDEPHEVGRDVEAVAFAYPDLFVRPLTQDGRDGGTARILLQLDVETGRVVAELPLPPGRAAANEDADVHFAANETRLAWTDGASLTVTDRPSGAQDRVADLPTSRGANGTQTLLTAGDDIVAYSSIPMLISGGPTYSAQSIVYDIRTGEQHALDVTVFAEGDWLLWEGGDGDASYYLGRVGD